ncbi:hypothetical protein HY988_00085 [Candidatus Micrarchaeota archaeon]|nr:hypothetical protein [Candidatus Micrarchaeota archaeon]
MNLENLLLEKIGKEKMEEEIDCKVESFHGLLNREAAMRIIAKEAGLFPNEEKFYRIIDVPKGGKRISISATIRKIWPTATYSSGKKSKVVEVADASGRKPLILWNEDVEIAKNLRVNDEIVVKGAYERNNELNLGYSGSVEVSKKSEFSNLKSLNAPGAVHLREIISRIEGKVAIETSAGDGKKTKVVCFVFSISNGEDEMKCAITEGIDRGAKLRVGDEVIIENGIMDSQNSLVILNQLTRLLSKRKDEVLVGTIKKLEYVEEGQAGQSMIVSVEDGDTKEEAKEIILDRENALRLMGLVVANDITLESVVSLKKDTLINTKIAVKVEERNGRIHVQR